MWDSTFFPFLWQPLNLRKSFVLCRAGKGFISLHIFWAKAFPSASRSPCTRSDTVAAWMWDAAAPLVSSLHELFEIAPILSALRRPSSSKKTPPLLAHEATGVTASSYLEIMIQPYRLPLGFCRTVPPISVVNCSLLCSVPDSSKQPRCVTSSPPPAPQRRR